MTAPTYRRILIIALPVIAANILLPLQSLVDTAIMAHRPNPAFAAALGISVSIFSFLYSSFNFLQYATSGLSAQSFGRSDFPALRAILWRSLALSLLVGVLLLIGQTPLIRLAHWYYHSSDDTAPLIALYTRFRIFGAFAELGNYCLIGWLAGQSRTREIFILQAVLTISNIILSLLLANGLKLDIVGVAIGTALAHYLAFATGIIMIARLCAQRNCPFFVLKKEWFAFKTLRPLFNLNQDIFIRTVMLMLCLSWFARLGSMRGDTILASNSILLGLLAITSFALDGVAVAAEGLTGQAIGANHRQVLWQVVRKTAITTAFFALALAGAFWALFSVYLHLMSQNAEILAVATDYRWWAIGLPLVAAGGYLLDGFYFGATAASTLRNMMLILAAITLPFASIFAHFFGNHGIWAGIYLFFLCRAGLLMWKLPKILF